MKDSDGVELQSGNFVASQGIVGQVIRVVPGRAQVRWLQDKAQTVWVEEGASIYKIEITTIHTCGLCGKPMTFTYEPVPLCRYCKEPNPERHLHVRCDDCSPPGWWAVIKQRRV